MSNPTEGWSMQPGGLARRLRELREATDMSGSALAVALDWQQSKVSRIETGKQIPSDDDIRAYARAVGADESAVQELLGLRSQATAINREWRQGVTGGQAAIQAEYGHVVRQGKVIRNLELTTIPGLLQTREYARFQKMQAVLLSDYEETEIEAALDAQDARQEVLRDPGKRFEFVVVEAALHLRYCPKDMMLAQLGHLLSFTYPRDNFWFGIIPFGQQLPLVPQTRFIAIDDQVLVEHFAGDTAFTEGNAAKFNLAMDHAVAEAVTGDEARRLIVAAMRALD